MTNYSPWSNPIEPDVIFPISKYKSNQKSLSYFNEFPPITSFLILINLIKFNLEQTFLDHEIITAPENISLLARKHLDIDLTPYKRSQIKKFNDKNEKVTKIEKKEKNIQKFKKLYSQPKSIPSKIKNHVTSRIEEKKIEIVNIYHEPKSFITLERAGRWTVVQLVKAFLGMPMFPRQF